MTKVTILGAHGQIARLVEQHFINHADVQMNLFARDTDRLPSDIQNAMNTEIIEGDVNHYHAVFEAIAESDMVYANLGGQFTPMVRNIVKAMNEANVTRLIYVTGLGLYHEVPDPFGTWLEQSVGHAVMEDTRTAAQLIENNLAIDYTIIRAAYMSNNDMIDYELTNGDEPFKGTTISRASIANLIEEIILHPNEHKNESLGISQPGTDGNTPIYK